MAYKNLVLEPCTSKAELFTKMRDFICARNATHDYSTTGVGWTLLDSSYAVDEDNPQLSDWFVIYSPGENGKEDLYCKFTWTSNYLSLSGYLYWNSTTHAGVQLYGGAGTIYVVESTGSYILSVYADLDFVHIFEPFNYASGGQWGGFGKLTDSAYNSDEIAVSSSAVSAGTGVVITLDEVPTSWTVGQNLFIRDETAVKILEVTAISGLTITANVGSSFSAGCKIQADLLYYCNNTISYLGGAMLTNRTTGAVTTTYSYPSGILTHIDPDGLNDDYLGAPHQMGNAYQYFGTIPYLFGTSPGSVPMVPTDPFDNGYRFMRISSNLYFAIKEI